MYTRGNNTFIIPIFFIASPQLHQIIGLSRVISHCVYWVYFFPMCMISGECLCFCCSTAVFPPVIILLCHRKSHRNVLSCLAKACQTSHIITMMIGKYLRVIYIHPTPPIPPLWPILPSTFQAYLASIANCT